MGIFDHGNDQTPGDELDDTIAEKQEEAAENGDDLQVVDGVDDENSDVTPQGINTSPTAEDEALAAEVKDENLSPQAQLEAYRDAGIPESSLVVTTFLDGTIRSVHPVWED
jgi:hypothetical protein